MKFVASAIAITIAGAWLPVCLSSAEVAAENGSKKVKVFILAGQSNMEGKAKLELLEYQIDQPETRDFFKHLRKDGKWVEREDVWINFLERRGRLTVGFGSPKCIGPELEFGSTVGDRFEEPVLLIKTAWGGKSLGRDFRPPSSGLPGEEELQEILRRTNDGNRKNKRAEITIDDVKAMYGRFYREMMEEIRATLDDLGTRFPDYRGQGYEISGFVWFQGWNDLFDPDFLEGYGTHMANFIRDVRKDLGRPDLPFVIGQMGQGGPEGANDRMQKIKDAQASMESIPEFRGNVKVVKTDVFWDRKAAALVENWRDHVEEWKKVGSDYGYHYLGSAITFSRIGRAFGEAMLELLRAPAETPAAGPLRAHPQNPRYFTDGTKAPDGLLRVVYLTGAHTWNNLVDMGRDDPPQAFDFDAYLDFLERHGHNFIRLWAWDSTVWDTRANGRLGKDFVHRAAPLPWERTGPGKALDGGPKFDLEKFSSDYFERLKARVGAAGRRGIYVSVMMFEGWGLMHGNRGRAAPAGWAWRAHPFHPENNINGIDAGKGGDGLSGDVHSLANPKVNAIQAATIRKVVDTVNDLDNVLYEVINEGGGKDWDWWVVKTIRDHERSKPKQHPIGITGHGAERLESMLASPADWISPGRADGFAEDPPAWNGKKVSLLDTDHIWGVGGNAAWVWKSFLRGHNPIFMDPYDGSVLGTPSDNRWEPIRRALGQTRRLAGRVDLAALEPRGDLASTGYCLADPGKAYLVYQPAAGKEFSVELKAGRYRFEWFDPARGESAAGGSMESSGGPQPFNAAFDGEAVLRLERDRSGGKP